MGIKGQTSFISINTFIQSRASVFREIVSVANGGDAGNIVNTGGGYALTTNPAFSQSVSAGGDGMVIIHY